MFSILNEANVFGVAKPTKTQLYNKIAAMKARIFPSDKILNTHDLRTRVTQHLEVPESDIEGYIPYYTIEDEDQNSKPSLSLVYFKLTLHIV